VAAHVRQREQGPRFPLPQAIGKSGPRSAPSPHYHCASWAENSFNKILQKCCAPDTSDRCGCKEAPIKLGGGKVDRGRHRWPLLALHGSSGQTQILSDFIGLLRQANKLGLGQMPRSEGIGGEGSRPGPSLRVTPPGLCQAHSHYEIGAAGALTRINLASSHGAIRRIPDPA
jgi:hypothetical protein